MFELGPQTFISSHTNQIVRSSTLIGALNNSDLVQFLQIKVSFMDLDFLNFDAINKKLLRNAFDKYEAPEEY